MEIGLHFATHHFHRRVDEVVLLRPCFRKDRNGRRQPCFGENAISRTARTIRINLALDLEQHTLFSFFGRRIFALLFCPCLQRFFIGHHEQNRIWILVIMEDTLVHVNAAVGKRVLKSLGAVFLSVRADEERFEPSNDPEVSRVRRGDIPHISGMQPSIHDCSRRALGVLPIARHDVFTLDHNLSSFAIGHDITFRIAYLQFHWADDSSGRAEDGSFERVRTDDRRCFAQSVALEHRHSDRAEIALQRDVEQRSTADKELHPSAEILTHCLENQSVKEFDERVSPRVLPSAAIPIFAVVSDGVIEGEIIEFFHFGSFGFDAGFDTLAEIAGKSRNREHHMRTHFSNGDRDIFECRHSRFSHRNGSNTASV